MAKFEITDLNPAKSTITAPDSVKINLKLSGDVGSKITLKYNLNPENNVYFDAKPKKNIIKSEFTLDVSPKTITDELKLVKDGTPDFPNCDIAIDADTADGNHTSATYQVIFS